MGTVVSIQLVGDDGPTLLERAKEAMLWVGEVERTCSRFDATSELSRLTTQHGQAVPVSAMLGQLLALACATAAAVRPEIRRIPTPPRPGGVAWATMVSVWLMVFSLRSRLFSDAVMGLS